MKCSKCGNPLEPGAVFCPSCGEKVEAQQTADGVNTVNAANTSYSQTVSDQNAEGGASDASAKKEKIDIKSYLTPENILDPSVTLNFDNLEFLCHDCHNREHGRIKIPKRYEILPDGGVRTDLPLFSNTCTDS